MNYFVHFGRISACPNAFPAQCRLLVDMQAGAGNFLSGCGLSDHAFPTKEQNTWQSKKAAAIPGLSSALSSSSSQQSFGICPAKKMPRRSRLKPLAMQSLSNRPLRRLMLALRPPHLPQIPQPLRPPRRMLRLAAPPPRPRTDRWQDRPTQLAATDLKTGQGCLISPDFPRPERRAHAAFAGGWSFAITQVPTVQAAQLPFVAPLAGQRPTQSPIDGCFPRGAGMTLPPVAFACHDVLPEGGVPC